MGLDFSNPNAITGNPFGELIQKYSAASPEKKVEGLTKIAAQFPGGPQQVFGVDPTAPAAVPGATPQQEHPVSAWKRFLDTITEDPQFAFDLGAQLLAPRPEGVSPVAHIVGGLSAATQRLAQRKKEEEAQKQAAEFKNRELTALEQRTGAQVEQAKATAEHTKRETESQGIIDDLMRAKAELARAQARRERQPAGSAAANKELIYDNMMGKILYKTYPDRFKSVDEAIAAWAKFKVDKGNTPLGKAYIRSMENLPYLPKDRVEEYLQQVKEAMTEVTGGIQPIFQEQEQPQTSQLPPDVPPADRVPPELWLKLEGEYKKDRARAEALYGKDVVARKIEEAKKLLNK